MPSGQLTLYAPTSGQVIDSISVLEQQLDTVTKKYLKNAVPMCSEYCGFHLVAETLYFYTLRDHTFSESLRFRRYQNEWIKELISS